MGSSEVAEGVDYLGAIALALEGAANLETANAVIRKIMEEAPQPNGEALWPTRILIKAITDLQGSFEVP